MLVLQGATYVLPLITIPYLVRVLGPADYGRMAFAQAFIAYFGILVDYGFNLSATRKVALIRENAEQLSRFVAAVMTVKIALAGIGLVIMGAMTTFIPRFGAERLLFLCTYASVAGNALFPVWLYRGLEEMKLISILTIAGRAVSVAGIFVFVHGQKDLLAAVLLQSSALILSGLPAIIMLPRLAPLRPALPLPGDIFGTLRDGWHAFISGAAVTLYTSSNVFVLGLLVSPIQVGYYSAANRILTAVCGLVNPVSSAVYPHIVGLIARSRDEALSFISRLLWSQGAATFMISFMLYIFAGSIVGMLLGSRFQPSVNLVRIMSGLPFLLGVSNVLGFQTMMTFDMKQAFTRILVSGGLVNLIFLFPAIHFFGDIGAAWTVFGIEALITSSMAASLRQAGLLRKVLVPHRPLPRR